MARINANSKLQTYLIQATVDRTDSQDLNHLNMKKIAQFYRWKRYRKKNFLDDNAKL